MKNMKNIVLTSLVLLTMVFALFAVSTSSEGVPNAKIAIVYSTGGLGDLSFNDAAHKGFLDAKATNPFLQTSQVEPSDVAEITSAISNFAADGSFDLIIGIGFTATDGITASATTYPNINFMIIDSVVPLPNVASVVFAEHEGSFLAGAMAAMVSETGDIAFLGGLNIPLINKFLAGYRQGARYINEEIIVRSTYAPNPSNPWGDLTGGKDVALVFIEQGSDVIYAAAGGTGIGVMDAAEEASTADNKIYAIGVDSNQDHLRKGFVLTSMIKRVDVAVSSQIQAIVDGTWVADVTEYDLAAGGVGITDMEFTKAEADAEFEEGVTRMQKIEEIKADIISGDIVVAFELDEEFEAAPAPFPILAAIMSLFAIPIIAKKRK
jgi:basic membrane protein A